MPSESPKATYVRDGFYIHDAAVWPLDAVDRVVEGMDAVRRGRVRYRSAAPALRLGAQVTIRSGCAKLRSPKSPIGPLWI